MLPSRGNGLRNTIKTSGGAQLPHGLFTGIYEKKVSALERAIDLALERSLESGDMDRLDRLLELIDRATREYRDFYSPG